MKNALHMSMNERMGSNGVPGHSIHLMEVAWDFLCYSEVVSGRVSKMIETLWLVYMNEWLERRMVVCTDRNLTTIRWCWSRFWCVLK